VVVADVVTAAERGDGSPVRLALDDGFPAPVLAVLGDLVADVALVPLAGIHPDLPTLDDRPLLVALHQLGWTGLVTAHHRMLRNPRTLAAILKTRITVFAVDGVGDDPLRALGAVLLDLPAAVRRVDPTAAQVFWMRPRNPQPESPWELFQDAARRHHRDATELYAELLVSTAELGDPIVTPR
jgi:hypothetical protein